MAHQIVQRLKSGSYLGQRSPRSLHPREDRDGQDAAQHGSDLALTLKPSRIELQRSVASFLSRNGL